MTKGHWEHIQGWFDFQQVYDQAVRDAPVAAHFVEVGSWKGKSAAYMLEQIQASGKRIQFDCVDTWEGSDEAPHLGDPAVIAGTLFDVFTANMLPFAGHYKAMRGPSVAVAEQYEPGTLSFVFIDASHDYQNVVSDIKAWLPLIRPGGVLAGHDYNHAPVREAVSDTLGAVRVIGHSWWLDKPVGGAV